MTLGWALIDFIWQGTFIGLVTAALLVAMRNATAEARYSVTCVSLVCCAALPIFSLFVDSSGAALALISYLGNFGFPLPSEVSWRTALQEYLPGLIALWATGFALLLTRLSLGLAWVRRTRDTPPGPTIVETHWQARLDQLARKLRLQRPVPLHALIGLGTPMTVGWWRPVVLVPASIFVRMPVKLVDALLAHELAHIKRHDYLVNVIQSCLEAFLFYHPVVWWLSRRIREERELIADRIAADAIGEPRNLALALQQLETFGATVPVFPAAQLAARGRGADLLLRIQRLVEPRKRALTWHIVLPVVGLATMCLMGNAYLVSQPHSPTSADTLTWERSPEQRREMESRVERLQSAMSDADRSSLERHVEALTGADAAG